MDETISADRKEMSVFEHLEELRMRLFRVLLFFFVAACMGFWFSERLLQVLLSVSDGAGISFIVISPTEGFFSQLKLGLLAGFVFSLPFNILEFWRFVSPGLTAKEIRLLYRTTPFLVLLFICGVALAFFAAIPLGLKFLLSFQIADVAAQISVEKYISFCLSLMLIFGFVFELPVLLLLLCFVGLLDREMLIFYRRHVILGIFIGSAVMTPPDIVTQVLIAAPLIMLYELSVFLAGFIKINQPPSAGEEANRE
jgi:sec-independent protein translocase protein TatC